MTASGPTRRRRGSGGLFPVAEGVWRVDVEVDPHPDTKRRRRLSRRVYGSREEAEEVLAELRTRPVTDTRAFNVRLTAGQADDLRALAAASGRTVAAELRLAVAAWPAAAGSRASEDPR